MGGLESMDSMDMPLTPASFAGLDHKVIDDGDDDDDDDDDDDQNHD